MKFQAILALALILGTANAGLTGGWAPQAPELTDENKDLINFGLEKISEASNGFQATEYSPVKILDIQTQVVAGVNTKILAEIDDGNNSVDSKMLVQMTIYTTLADKNHLSKWYALSSAHANFELLTSVSTANDVLNKISAALTYEDLASGRNAATYKIKRTLAAFTTKQYDQTFTYIKLIAEGTDNSVRLHEFWMVGESYDVFAHVKLPIKPQTLQQHPELETLKDEAGFKCENILSYFLCQISTGCVNNMLTTGKCEKA